jgi:DNA repair protein RecN (Recombination protein N)
MLQTLRIKNYAIIKDTQISFTGGLNIITGETGAGKSILLGALGLILGNRADSKAFYNGADKCVVEGVFDISNYQLQALFDTYELDYEPQTILRREITLSGKSRAFVNDTPVNLQVLKTIAEQLVDIVSQHQTLELNEASFQLNLVDAIADNQNLLKNYLQQYKLWVQKKQLLTTLLEKEAQARKEEDYIKFVLKEFEDAALQANEQFVLEEKLQRLSNASLIQQAAGNVGMGIDGVEQAIVDQLRVLRSELLQAAKHYKPLEELANRIESNIIDLKDIASELQDIAEQSQSNPRELAETEERLQMIYNLQKKHRVDSIEDLLALEEKFSLDLLNLGNLEEQIEKVTAECSAIQGDLLVLAKKLSDKRKLAIETIKVNMQKLLQEVALPNAVFEVDLRNKSEGSIDHNGMDDVTFLFSANKGTPLLPVNKAASGGELSRLMLCIKSLISNKIQLPTVIFDEIDTGISGETAQKVAGVLQEHAKAHQVIAITHLAQIAARAQSHFYVYKEDNADTTLTQIKKLNKQERVAEIARMLSGENPSETVLNAAKELIAAGA